MALPSLLKPIIRDLATTGLASGLLASSLWLLMAQVLANRESLLCARTVRADLPGAPAIGPLGAGTGGPGDRAVAGSPRTRLPGQAVLCPSHACALKFSGTVPHFVLCWGKQEAVIGKVLVQMSLCTSLPPKQQQPPRTPKDVEKRVRRRWRQKPSFSFPGRAADSFSSWQPSSSAFPSRSSRSWWPAPGKHSHSLL